MARPARSAPGHGRHRYPLAGDAHAQPCLLDLDLGKAGFVQHPRQGANDLLARRDGVIACAAGRLDAWFLRAHGLAPRSVVAASPEIANA